MRSAEDISAFEFKKYCLKPAMEMRQIIRMQMGYADEKYQGSMVPAFTIREVDE